MKSGKRPKARAGAKAALLESLSAAQPGFLLDPRIRKNFANHNPEQRRAAAEILRRWAGELDASALAMEGEARPPWFVNN